MLCNFDWYIFVTYAGAQFLLLPVVFFVHFIRRCYQKGARDTIALCIIWCQVISLDCLIYGADYVMKYTPTQRRPLIITRL